MRLPAGAGLPWQDTLCHPPAHHTSAGRHRGPQHSWEGMEGCQGTKQPSLHRQALRAPRRHEALPSSAARRRTGSVEWKRSPAVARRPPAAAAWPWPLLPPGPRRRSRPTPRSQPQDGRQSPGKLQGSESQSRVAEKRRARQGGHGDTTQNRAEVPHACARRRHPGASTAPALGREWVAGADPPLQLHTPLAQPLCGRRGAETSGRKTGLPQAFPRAPSLA